MSKSDEFEAEVLNNNNNNNNNNTDTLQWCQLHLGHCNDVVPVRRHFEDPSRQDEIFMACQSCIRDLKKAGLLKDSKFAKLPCVEVVVPEGLCQGRVLGPEFTTRQRSNYPGKRSYEVTLDALQAKYLRALGLKVIPA